MIYFYTAITKFVLKYQDDEVKHSCNKRNGLQQEHYRHQFLEIFRLGKKKKNIQRHL